MMDVTTDAFFGGAQFTSYDALKVPCVYQFHHPPILHNYGRNKGFAYHYGFHRHTALVFFEDQIKLSSVFVVWTMLSP